MAKIDTAAQYETLRKEIEAGEFQPVYILMGEEPFYPERLCALITDRALQPHERDFNQTVLYGADTSSPMSGTSTRQCSTERTPRWTRSSPTASGIR